MLGLLWGCSDSCPVISRVVGREENMLVNHTFLHHNATSR